jgi:inorganic triphosphatase YgiF
VGTEIELKLVTSQSALRKAMMLPWLRKMAGETVKHRHLTSVYFDTPKLALRDHEVSLRVRRVGDQRLQTIKATSGALVMRDEWEQSIEGDQPKLELATGTALGPLLSRKLKDQLQPVFETDVDRAIMLPRIGKSEIELAFDTGRINTADAHVDITEIEIELKHGERHDAAMLARRFARSVPITYEPRSKSERGYALLEGSLDAPVFARSITIPPSATAEDAFVIIGFECLRHFATNEAAVRRNDPEGIHQMRVGLRRLRAALSLFKEILQGADFRKLKAELVWLTEQLGPARDYDVLVSKTLHPFRSSHHSGEEFTALERDFNSQRKAGFSAAKAALESRRFHRLLLDIALWLFDGDWRNNADALETSLRKQPIGKFAEQEVTRRMRKIAKRVRKLRAIDPRRRHRLRIAVKKVRYAREFFETLAPDGGRNIDGALKNLQDALGNLNDITVHSTLAHSLARINSATHKAYAIGYLTGQEEIRSEEIVSEAIQAGRQLRRAI